MMHISIDLPNHVCMCGYVRVCVYGHGIDLYRDFI